ncbi:oligosaccharide repeat unit polymerase [Flammeovirga pectinis]|uniref:Oligosaccharide repeat unit polymerase n=1 Tax=Flammeovirga pectinis TaxID=2494373 RepID=A0A3Q9FK34_9BACT|nr:O-antigen polymerase [Flammeovirga pectinis]AZQ61548.1 oligosaccharide repeat unit polymerase [Flammeovirga pectinis]
MNQILQIVSILILLSLTFKLKRLQLIYIAVLISTHFFGVLEKQDLLVNGKYNFINYISQIFIIIALTKNYILFDLKKKFNNNFTNVFILYFLFFGIQILSFILTLSGGFSFTQSLMPFLDFVTYIYIFPLFILFKKTEKQEVLFFLKLIIVLSIFNTGIFILNYLHFLNFYTSSKSMIIGNNIERSLEGFPFFFKFLFPILYINFRRRINLQNFILFAISIISIILTYTRSIIISYFIVILVFELISRKNKVNITHKLKFLIFILLGFVFLTTFFNKNINVVIERFSEGTSINNIQNLNSRSEVTIDRITLTLKENPLFGIGYISNNEAYKIPLKTDTFRVIHPDIFWPNLFVTTGLFGSIIFVFNMILLLRYFFFRRHSDMSMIIFLFIIFSLLLTFSSGGDLFKHSLNFVIIISLGMSYYDLNIFDNENKYFSIRK